MTRYITFFTLIIILVACTKGRVYNKTTYFEVENLTSHQVTISFFDPYSADTALVKEYFIGQNFSGIIDTAKFEYVPSGEDNYCKVLTPNSSYPECENGFGSFWGGFSLSQYRFDDVKITELKELKLSSFESCDTSSVTTACLIIEKDSKEEFVNRKNSNITEVIKYYITEQQYALADSI